MEQNGPNPNPGLKLKEVGNVFLCCFAPLKSQLIVGRLTEDVELQENSNERKDRTKQKAATKTGFQIVRGFRPRMKEVETKAQT